jgi:hypothetical protein
VLPPTRVKPSEPNALTYPFSSFVASASEEFDFKDLPTPLTVSKIL